MGDVPAHVPVVPVSPRLDPPIELSASPDPVGSPLENDTGHSKGNKEITKALNADEIDTANSPGNNHVIAAALDEQTLELDNEDLPNPMLKEPDTRRVSLELLVAEVKGIYAGLVLIESKCIETDSGLDSPTRDLLDSSPTHHLSDLNQGQYTALIMLHRTLLQEYCDFFLASQHPSASPALRELAEKYSMPARMCKHGIFTFLEVLRHRLPRSREFMATFTFEAHSILALLDETVPQFRSSWVESKADVARYSWAVCEESDIKERWKYICHEEYSRVLDDDPTIGRVYHHLAILAKPQSTPPQSDADFEATVLQFFYLTKSLVVKTPFFAVWDSLFPLINPIMARNKEEAGKPASVPLTDKDHFLTAVTNLILASLDPKFLSTYGYKTSKKDHLQAVYAALKKLSRPACGEQAETYRIRPSAQLGLLLCHLLLGIPPAPGRWSPMMAAWAPSLVTHMDRADLSARMSNARDIHEATIAMIHTMVPYLLEVADTRDLRVWGFIYVILVFMRSLKWRHNLKEWFSGAFHAEMLAPFLNMLLREDEARGWRVLQSTSQSELLNLCSPLNQKEKLGKYGLSATDHIKKYLDAQESRATTEATTSDAAHRRDKTICAERTYTNPLPEDELLRGHFFAREASLPNTVAAEQAAEGQAVDQAQEDLLDSETEESERKNMDMQRVDEQKESENKELQEGLQGEDPPLFPAGWFKNSKYNFDERQVRQDYVQDADTHENRSKQLLCLASQLIKVFFDFHTDKSGCCWISELGAPPPEPYLNLKMPEVIEPDGCARVVYVDPSFHVAEMEKERNRTAREEKKRQIEEEDDAKTTTDAATVVREKAVLDKTLTAENDTKAIKCCISLANSDGVDQGEDEDEDNWTHVSDGSCEEGTRAAQVALGSVIWRYIFG